MIAVIGGGVAGSFVKNMSQDASQTAEHGEDGLLFPSGMAAVAAVMRTVPNGGRIVMQSGIYWGYIGLIEGIVGKILEEMPKTETETLVLATGGLAPLFAGSTDIIDKVDEELTLKGLQRIYQGLRVTDPVRASALAGAPTG